MTSIRIGSQIFATIADALQAAKVGDTILLDEGIFSASSLLAKAPNTTLKGIEPAKTKLFNTNILERSGIGKNASGFTIQDITFDYNNKTGYLFSPSIGSVPYNPLNPVLTSFTLKNVVFKGVHQGNVGVSGTYMDISGAKNTIFDGISVSLSGQAGYNPTAGTGGGFFIFHEGGADIQIRNSVFNESGYSASVMILFTASAYVASNSFTGAGLIKQDDETNPADNPRGSIRFYNAGGLFTNNHLSNGSFFEYFLNVNSDTGTVWTDYKKKYTTADGTFGLFTAINSNTFDVVPTGYGILIRADISPLIVQKMLTISNEQG
jgi:hypothetical protein